MPDSLKRVDVLLLTQNKVVVLEFKEKREILKDDIAQVAGYSQSISQYHYLTEENDMAVSAYLVYTPGGRYSPPKEFYTNRQTVPCWRSTNV